MYIENKGDEQIIGFGSIGRVSFSKTGKIIYHKRMTLEKYQGFKSNYINAENQEILIGFQDVKRVEMIPFTLGLLKLMPM